MKTYKEFVKETKKIHRWLIGINNFVKKDDPKNNADKDKANHVWAYDAKSALTKDKEIRKLFN